MATPTTKDLAVAARDGKLDEMEALLQLPTVSIDEEVEFGGTSLSQAALANQLAAVTFLLDKGANINATTTGGMSVVALAAEKGFVEVTKALVERGADLALKDRHGRNSIHSAAFQGRASTLAVLAVKASPEALNAQDVDGNSPLLLAARYGGSVEAVKVLCNAKADLKLVNAAGHTASDAARHAGKKEIEDAIVDAELEAEEDA
jgi:ankyrin repeat protein